MATSKITKTGNAVMQVFKTGSEIDTIFTIPADYRGIMFIDDTNTAFHGAWIIACGSTSSVYFSEIKGNTGETISSPENGKLKITRYTERELYVGFLSMTPDKTVIMS